MNGNKSNSNNGDFQEAGRKLQASYQTQKSQLSHPPQVMGTELFLHQQMTEAELPQQHQASGPDHMYNQEAGSGSYQPQQSQLSQPPQVTETERFKLQQMTEAELPQQQQAAVPDHMYSQHYLNAPPEMNANNELVGNYVAMPFPEPWGPMGFSQAFVHHPSHPQHFLPQQQHPIMMLPAPSEPGGVRGLIMNQHQQRDIPWQLAYNYRRNAPTTAASFSGDNESMVHTPTSGSLASYDTGRRVSMCSSSQNGGAGPVSARTRSAIKQRSSDPTRMFKSAVSMSGGPGSISSLDTSITSIIAAGGSRKRRKRALENSPESDDVYPTKPKVMAMSIKTQDDNQIILEEITPRIDDHLEQKRMTRSQAHKMKEMMRKKPEMWKEGLKHPRHGSETLPVMPENADTDGLWSCPRCFKRQKTQRLLKQHLAFHARANSLSPEQK